MAQFDFDASTVAPQASTGPVPAGTYLAQVIESDIKDLASGNGKGQIFVKGEVIKTVPESQIVETLIEEAMRLAELQRGADGDAGGSPVVTVS